MRIVHCVEYGPPENLVARDVERPVPGVGQVLVEVKACGINFPDGLIIEDKYQFHPERPFAPGGEIAGTIAAVGPEVEGWALGDDVIAFTIWGGLAEAVVIDAHRLIPKPVGMGFSEAAAFVMTAGTALHALKDRAQLKAGETLLVLGAAGGVGSAAVQIGRAMGAHVIGAASTSEKAAFCRKMGAHECVNYEKIDLKERVREITGGQGVDIVFDPVGGRTAETAVRLMNWGGRYLVVGFASGDVPKFAGNLVLLKGCAVVGVFWGSLMDRGGEERKRHLIELEGLYQDGHIRPQISERYVLNQAAAAIRRVMDRKAVGKIVVEM